MLSGGQPDHGVYDVTPSHQDEIAALRREVETLRAALTSSRLIGAAVGLVMAEHQLTRESAFEMLRVLSQNSNVRLAALAYELVGRADDQAGGTKRL